MIAVCLDGLKANGGRGRQRQAVEEQVRTQVAALTKRFPIY